MQVKNRTNVHQIQQIKVFWASENDKQNVHEFLIFGNRVPNRQYPYFWNCKILDLQATELIKVIIQQSSYFVLFASFSKKIYLCNIYDILRGKILETVNEGCLNFKEVDVWQGRCRVLWERFGQKTSWINLLFYSLIFNSPLLVLSETNLTFTAQPIIKMASLNILVSGRLLDFPEIMKITLKIIELFSALHPTCFYLMDEPTYTRVR